MAPMAEISCPRYPWRGAENKLSKNNNIKCGSAHDKHHSRDHDQHLAGLLGRRCRGRLLLGPGSLVLIVGGRFVLVDRLLEGLLPLDGRRRCFLFFLIEGGFGRLFLDDRRRGLVLVHLDGFLFLGRFGGLLLDDGFGSLFLVASLALAAALPLAEQVGQVGLVIAGRFGFFLGGSGSLLVVVEEVGQIGFVAVIGRFGRFFLDDRPGASSSSGAVSSSSSGGGGAGLGFTGATGLAAGLAGAIPGLATAPGRAAGAVGLAAAFAGAAAGAAASAVTSVTFWQSGHFTFLPSRVSDTFNFLPHAHENEIAMKDSSSRCNPLNAPGVHVVCQ